MVAFEQNDVITRIYHSAAQAAGVEYLDITHMSQEEIRKLNTPSIETLKRQQEIENEQANAWFESRLLPLGN